METFFAFLSVLAGGVLAVQAGANAQLSKAVASPFGATTLQLLIAAVLLGLLGATVGTLAGLTRLGNVPWWHAVGGAASAFYVVSTILLFPRLGAVASVGLFIAGQMLASLGLDTLGWIGIAAKPFTAWTGLGLAAVLGGAVAIVIGQKDGLSQLSPRKLGWIALALAAGAVLPVQGAVNALLRQDIGDALAVGTISFIVATLAMAAAMIIAVPLLRAPWPSLGGLRTMPWWGWLGGFAGAAYVSTMFTAMPAIGAAATVGLTVAGQQITSVLVDRFGWFRLPHRPISAARLAGIAVLLTGVAIIKFS